MYESRYESRQVGWNGVPRGSGFSNEEMIRLVGRPPVGTQRVASRHIWPIYSSSMATIGFVALCIITASIAVECANDHTCTHIANGIEVPQQMGTTYYFAISAFSGALGICSGCFTVSRLFEAFSS